MFMHSLCTELEIAMECELVIKALDVLVDIADLYVQHGEKERAAEILALVMEYPARPVTMERADALFDELQWQLCPRVIADAQALAGQITLDEMVTRVLMAR